MIRAVIVGCASILAACASPPANDPPLPLATAIAVTPVPTTSEPTVTPDDAPRPPADTPTDPTTAGCPPSTDDGPPSALSEGARAQWTRPPRAIALLVTEIQQLEALKSASSPGAPDRPTIELRIALDYYELEANAYRECSNPATNPNMIPQRLKIVRAARTAAMRQCADLEREYPTFPKSRPCPTQ